MSWVSLFDTDVQADGFLTGFLLFVAILGLIIIAVVAVLRKGSDVKNMTAKKKSNKSKKKNSKGERQVSLKNAILTSVCLCSLLVMAVFFLFVSAIPQSELSQGVTEKFVPWNERVHTCPICGWQGTTEELDVDNTMWFGLGDDYYDCPSCGYDDKNKEW